MTSVYESPRLRRECLVCSYECARLAVIGVSVRGGGARGWRFVSRSRACRLRRQRAKPLSADESRQTFVGQAAHVGCGGREQSRFPPTKVTRLLSAKPRI